MDYYYLISGLPDLHFSESSTKLDFDEIIDTIRRNLNPEDEELSRYLFYPNDNRNLLGAIFRNYKAASIYDYQEPSFFEPDVIDDFSRRKGFLPEYMNDFLSKWEEHFPSMLMWEIEEKLEEIFQIKIQSLDNDFIRNYFLFETRLKKLMAVLNNEYAGKELPELPQSHQSLINQVGKGKAPSASLFKDYPYAVLLGELFVKREPQVIEEAADKILWDYLSGAQDHFKGEAVFAYCLKLFLVKKWSRRRQSTDLEHFEKLYGKIKNDVLTTKAQEI